MELLTVLLLGAALLLTRVSNLRTAVNILMVQAIMVALACVFIGLDNHEIDTFIAAFLTVIVKAALIPYALFGIAKRLKRERELHPLLGANQSSLAACLLIVLSYTLIDQVLPMGISRDALAAAVALTLIGLFLIMTRHQAIMQIVGLVTMENGIYLLGLSVTHGLPLIIDLGIFFDILVLVVVLAILTYRLKLSFMTTDTSRLKKLKG
jgi:hydrogenase-4 component E